MGLFSGNNPGAQTLSSREQLERRYESSRHNILLVVAFTLINIILLVANANSYFLFSASVPYALADLAMYFCGKYPAEYYGGDLTGAEFFGNEVFVVMMVISAVILLVYLLAWFLSKNRKVGWMIFALVLFVIDTLGMFFLFGFSADSIMDIVFHAWVVVSLAMGISAHFKLKKLPVEEEMSDAEPVAAAPAEPWERPDKEI